jgi:phosphoribosyl 1,2-cyclic phosphodiesterase
LDIRFYGVRGSIASPLTAGQIEEKFRILLSRLTPEDLKDSTSREAFLKAQSLSLKGTYGGNTTCVALRSGNSRLLIDMGTGLRRFGQDCLDQKIFFPQEEPLFVLLTHLHWDHIQGFPFFVPAYIPGNHIHFYSVRDGYREDLLHQQLSPWCPAHFDFMQAKIDFFSMNLLEETNFGPWKVKSLTLHHPDGNVGYRVEAEGHSFVFLSDTEITGFKPRELKPYQDFCRGADAVYVDCQYDLIGAYEKAQWGHSSVFSWLDAFSNCGIDKMYCGHFDPSTSDAQIEIFLEKARSYAGKIREREEDLPKVFLAYEDLEISLGDATVS